MSEVWVNDVDLGGYGFVLGQNPNHASAPEFSDATAQLPGQIGPIWLAEPTQANARRLLLAGSVKQSSAATYRTAIDQLKALVSAGAVRVRFVDRTDQEFRDCRLVGFEVASKVALLTNLAGDVAITLEAADPLRYDVNPQGIPLSTGRASLPIGTAPSFPMIVIHGGGATLTTPTLTYRNADGDVVTTMTLSTASLGSGVLGANDYVVIDCTRVRVTKSIAGTQSDGSALWSAGDFPVIRPADGWWELAQYPTLELSASAGTPVGLITYTRRWV